MSVELLNMDCMDYMAGLPDAAFDLALVDPPYGVNAGNMQMGKGKNQEWKRGDWDKNTPAPEYFDELFRVSKKQIIFGGNYFDLPLTGGWLFWDKERGKDVSFADGELAWTSFLAVLKKVSVRYDGFIGADPVRIHPTQKPVALYRRILQSYAQPGDRILDTHLGSGSSAIAAHYAGFDFVGIDLDADYYHAATARFDRETAQISLL